MFDLAQYGNWTIEQLVPPLAQSQGGTLINIFGSNFPLGNLSCAFGELLTNATVHSSSQVSCLSPASPSIGVVPFYVIYEDLLSVGGVTFTFYGNPFIHNSFKFLSNTN